MTTSPHIHQMTIFFHLVVQIARYSSKIFAPAHQRTSGRQPVGHLPLRGEVSGVGYHPAPDGRLFAVCTLSGDTELYDSRMALREKLEKVS